MNTDTAANVQIAGEAEWQYRYFFSDPDDSGWGRWERISRSDLEWFKGMAIADPAKYEVRPLYTAASLAAITADRDRLREALGGFVTVMDNLRIDGHGKKYPYAQARSGAMVHVAEMIDAARAALESQ